MSNYKALPQLTDDLFLTDGGLETFLIFQEGVDLPHFAAFPLLDSEDGLRRLAAYYEHYLAIASQNQTGFILESPTWRASHDWGAQLGYSAQTLDDLNRRAIYFLLELKQEYATRLGAVVVSGSIGPRGDGYDPGTVMTPAEAQAYHSPQVQSFAAAGADFVTATTMTNTSEAIGIARAAHAAGIPAAISFTLETNGRLPTGQNLESAIAEVDQACEVQPAYYMINCAHPTHFAALLAKESAWSQRLRGLRANASRHSHKELDEATSLDAGDPVELGEQYAALRQIQPQLTVLGGCCGTDHRHVREIYEACRPS